LRVATEEMYSLITAWLTTNLVTSQVDTPKRYLFLAGIEIRPIAP